MNKIIFLAIFGSVLACAVAKAQESSSTIPDAASTVTEGKKTGEPTYGPPPEAYKACEGKIAGSRGELGGPHGDTVKGSCENDGNGKIVLRPDRLPKGDLPRGHRGAPPEAYAACVGKTLGGKTQFVSPRGDTVNGTCENAGEVLVLRPDRSPGITIDER